MLISKFDLYKTEWLDLVFDDRNKEYGAYDLRKHYAGNVVRAMGITFLGVGLLCGATIIFKTVPAVVKVIPVDLTQKIFVLPPPTQAVKKAEQPQPPKPIKSQPPAQAPTIKFLVPVVTSQPVTDNPPKNVDLTSNIGTQTTKGPSTAIDLPPTDGPAAGGTGTAPDVVHTLDGLDVMPTPVGGEAAWAKFLNKNLRFPAEAQDAGVGGRVILSFIIEKDGSLSNITVDRKAGYGFDEEALRVLRLAKAWKPGQQNGQPVRVKYMIPINFQVADPN